MAYGIRNMTMQNAYFKYCNTDIIQLAYFFIKNTILKYHVPIGSLLLVQVSKHGIQIMIPIYIYIYIYILYTFYIYIIYAYTYIHIYL